MKINFEKNINGFQEARKLKMILEHYAHSDISDKPTILLVESMIEELDQFVSDPEFEKFNHSKEMDISLFEEVPAGNPLLDFLGAIWRSLFGPGRRELLLSKQRQELLERAERAESMAFEALSETAEVGRQRDEALRKLKAENATIATPKTGSVTRDYVDGPFGQIHIYHAGKPKSPKTPLLLLHPTATSGFFFYEYIKEMARNRYVIAPDTPGYGRSDPPPEPQSIEALSSALLNVPKTLEIHQFDILGFHTGASLAVDMAVQNPRAVRRLILFGLPYYPKTEQEKLYEEDANPGPVSEDISYVERYWHEYITNREPDITLERAAMSFSERMMSYPRSHWGYHSVFSQDLITLLPQVKQPTLIPTAEGCHTDQIRAISALMPDTKCIEDAGFRAKSFQRDVSKIVQLTKDFLD